MTNRHSSIHASAIALAALSLVGAAFQSAGAELDRYIDYVETHGSGTTAGEYVLLDYRPTSNTVVELQVLLKGVSANNCFFCSRGNATDADTYTLFFVKSSSGTGLRWDYNRTAAEFQTGMAANTKYTIRCSPNGLWRDGVQCAAIHVSPLSYTPANRMMLFASYTCDPAATPAPTSNYAGIRLYSFKAWDEEGGALSLDLHPCIDTDGVAALYDAVSGKLYYNLNTSKTFGTGAVTSARFSIQGDPHPHGTPQPAYTEEAMQLAVGEELALSMPSREFISGTATNTLVGWKLESVAAGTGERTLVRSSDDDGETIDTCAYVQQNLQDAVFTWLWETRDAPGATAPVALSVDASSLTVATELTGIGYTAPSATLKIACGPSPSALVTTNVVSTSVTPSLGVFSTSFTRLVPNTPYYFQAILETNDEAHDTAVSPVSCIWTADNGEHSRQLAYIQSTGTQFIDTGHFPTPTTRTVFDFQLIERQNQVRFFGTEGDVSGNLVYSMYQNGSGQFAYARQDDKGNWTGLGVATDLNRHLIDFNFLNASNKRAITVSGTTINYAISQTATKTGLYTMYLGCSHTSAGAASLSKHRIYAAQIYDGDTAVRDFIAETRGGVAGLYDRVERVFHASGAAAAYVAGPYVPQADLPFVATESIENARMASVSLAFDAATAARPLRIAYGPVHGGSDPADWDYTDAVDTIAAGDTSYVWTPPADFGWGGETNLVLRFYFDDGPTPADADWSNSIYWRDATAPVVTDIAIDGTGGDTLVVSGNLASFTGDDCTLTVYTGTSPTTLDNAWAGLANAVRDETGAFSLTLFESNTAAARYLQFGETYYVTVEAVSGGKVSRTAPVAVTISGASVFASATSAVARRTVTFTGRFSDLGAGAAPAVTLYVGAATDAEEDLVAVESPVTVTDTTAFTITHTFDDFETTYKWQLRAVAPGAGGSASIETRSAVATAKTLDTTTYTWKPSVASGDWSDAANWTDNQGGDSLGYPSTANATVTFADNTTATVRFTEALTVGAITIGADSDLTFTQGGESLAATKLTAASIQLPIGTDLDKCVTFDGVSFQSNDFFSLYASRSLRIVNGANIYVAKSFANQLTDYVLVAGGSIVNCNDLYFSGGTLTISNATVQARNFAYVGNLNAGGHVVFQGTTPKLYCSYNSGCFYAAKTAIQLDFLVPVGGYEAAPIQGPASPAYIFGNNKGSAGAYSYTVNVLDESPANFVDASVTTPLISWTRASSKGGINKTRVTPDHLPAYGEGAVTDDVFAWSTDDATYPTSLSVTINGSSNADQLHVIAVPALYGAGSVSPDYGYTTVASGIQQPCTAPAIVQLSDVARAVCTGWKLYAVNPATLARTLLDSGAENEYTYTGAGAWRELEWQWELQYLVTAAASGPGSASPASQWIAAGDTATVTATPNDATSLFHSWSDGVLGGEYNDNPLTIAVNTNFAFTARFGGDYYVSTQGSDANDGLTPATALATIGEAVDRANLAYGSRITVLPGTHSLLGMEVWTTLTNVVTLASQSGNPDDTILDCGGGYGIHIDNAGARVEGFAFSNSYGGAANGHALWISGGSATNISICNLTGMAYAAVRVSGGELAGLLFTNNVNSTKSASNGGVILNASGSRLVTSTFIRNKAGGAPVRITSVNCYVEDCNFLTNLYVSSYANQYGGAVYADPNPGSTYIRRCRFIGNAGNECGACFLNRGGTVSDCFFQGNEAFYHGSCLRGWYGSGTFDRCAFIDNVGNDHGIFSFSETTITVRNCLFSGNRSKGGAPGVITSSRNNHFQNCTFYGNRSLTGGTHALYLSHASASVKNCIFYGNGPAADSRNAYVATAANIQNTCYPEAVEGNTTGNFAANPLFVNAETGDFHLQYGSPCIDAGQNLLTVDLDGDERPQDGNGDDVAVSDLGCYEMPPNETPLVVTMQVASHTTIEPATATLSAFVTGTAMDSLSFQWLAIRDASGVVTTNTVTTSEMATADTAEYTFSDLAAGNWRFEVVVRNESPAVTVTAQAAETFIVAPDTCYVSTTGSHTWPFDTLAGAATNFAEAVALGPRTIRVAAGEYAADLPRMTDATLAASWLAAIETPTAIIGPDDPAEAVVRCGGALGFYLGNANASVSGLTFAGAGSGTAGAALRLDAGSASNVVVSGGNADIPVRLAAGTLFTDSLVMGASGSWCNTVVASYGATMRGVIVRNCSGYKYCAVSLVGGTSYMENCAVINNNCHEMGGIRVSSAGIITDCVVSNNVGGGSYEYQGTGGVHINGGNTRLIRCRIVKNTGVRSGAVSMTSGACYATNCLFAANTGNNYSGGVQVLGGSACELVNCTIADSKSNKTGSWYQGANVTTARALNCIFAGNTVADVEKDLFVADGITAPVFSHTRYTEAVEGNADGNTAADPLLKDDWSLGSASPCIGTGDWTLFGAPKAEVKAQKDLAGNNRLFGGQIDMGCFESRIAPTMLFLR